MFTLISLVVLKLTFAYPQNFSNHCTTEQISTERDLCSPFVEALAPLMDSEKYYPYLFPESMENVTKICNKVRECYMNSECDSHRELGEMYKTRCDQLEFLYYDMKDCISEFHEQGYEEKYDCIKDHDYFSNNMTTRKAAWISGKSCLMGFACQSSTCTANSMAYLISHYDQLLGILTTDTDGSDQCESFFDELNGKQCGRLARQLDNAYAEWMLENETNGVEGKFESSEANVTAMCNLAETCMSQFCTYNKTLPIYKNELCKTMMEAAKKFDQLPKSPKRIEKLSEICNIRFRRHVNISREECVEKNDEEGIQFPIVKLSEYLSNKECRKVVVQGRCEDHVWMSYYETWKKAIESDPKKMFC